MSSRPALPVLIGLAIALAAPAFAADGVAEKAERVAQKTGAAIEYGAEKAKQGVVTAAQHTDKALHTAADATEGALKKTGNKIQEVVHGDK